MDLKKVRNAIAIFFLGLAVGGFFAVVVVREAVPLRDHVWMIGMSMAAGSPIIAALLYWYFRLARAMRTTLGPKGGALIAQILGFQIVSTILVFIVLLSIFYAAIA